MKPAWRANRREIPPPTVMRLEVGDLLRRRRDGAVCLVMDREYMDNWGTVGRERYRYQLHTNNAMVWLNDMEIIAGYEVLTKHEKT